MVLNKHEQVGIKTALENSIQKISAETICLEYLVTDMRLVYE